MIADLAAQGHAGISKANLSQWRRGGYTTWLKEQEAFERLHGLTAEGKAALGQLQPAGRNAMADLGEALLASHLSEMLQASDTEERAGRSEDFLRLARTFTGFMMARAQRQRVELERAKQEAEARKARPKAKEQGLTNEDEAEIVERIKLL